MRLFVYGTLMRGERAEGLMASARFLCEATTEARFSLVSMGEYPALVDGGTTAVVGEVYEVTLSLLKDLDRYEDAPAFYRRERILVGGEPVWTYLLPPEEAAGQERIGSGDWRKR